MRIALHFVGKVLLLLKQGILYHDFQFFFTLCYEGQLITATMTKKITKSIDHQIADTREEKNEAKKAGNY